MIEINPKYVEGIKKRFEKPPKISIDNDKKNQKIIDYMKLDKVKN